MRFMTTLYLIPNDTIILKNLLWHYDFNYEIIHDSDYNNYEFFIGYRYMI